MMTAKVSVFERPKEGQHVTITRSCGFAAVMSDVNGVTMAMCQDARTLHHWATAYGAIVENVDLDCEGDET